MYYLKLGSILIIIILISCTPFEDTYSAEIFKDKLEAQTKRKINNRDTIIIDIKELTDFDWDFFFVVTPYSNLSKVGKITKINVDILKRTNIRYRDSMNLLVFVRNGKIIKYVEFLRLSGDFSYLENYELFSPKEAVFIVEEIDKYKSGNKYLIIKKIETAAENQDNSHGE